MHAQISGVTREWTTAQPPRPTIVVGYDGSKESREALRAAAAQVGDGGTVVAVYAAEPASNWLDTADYTAVLRNQQEKVERVFGDLTELELGDVAVEAEVVDGPAPEALADVARARGAREIYVGSRGLGRVRAALGSVSHELVRIADRPVVVVPRSVADARGAVRAA